VYLRLSITDRCNLRCVYCRTADHRDGLDDGPLDDDELVALVRRIAEGVPVHKVRITGGEPTLRESLAKLVRELRAALPAARLAITTNGVRFAPRARELREAGLVAVNFSVDSVDPSAFRSITRGGRLADVVSAVRAARDAGYPSIRLNAVLLRSYASERLPSLVRFAAEHGAEMRFIELMPFGEGARLHAAEYLAADEAIRAIDGVHPWLGPRGDADTARRHSFAVDGRAVAVGFVTTMSEPFCASCDRLRLDSRGRLYSCLRDEVGVDLARALRAGPPERVREAVRELVASKRPPEGAWPTRSMVTIGG
jgi:cyclic pyranopterin phosphate synthase